MSQPSDEAFLLQEAPTGAGSGFKDDDTFEKDVFDGIEDVYTDLESSHPPAPPLSREDILEAQRLNISSDSSAESTVSDESSIGINKNEEAKTYVDSNDGDLCFCGVPGNSSKLGSLWNAIANPQSYFEVKDEPAKKNPIEQQRSDSVCGMESPSSPAPNPVSNMDVEMVSSQNGEMKTKIFTQNDLPEPALAVDTIIHHKIDQEEEEQEKPKKGYAGILEMLQQRNPFGDFKKEDAVDEEDNRERKSKNAYQTAMAYLKEKALFGGSEADKDDAMRRKKMRKYEPSFWTVLGQQKFYGVSLRLLLLVAINLFALMLLIILITQLTGRDEDTRLDTDAQIANVPTIEIKPIDGNADDGANLELLALCDEEGVTMDDGVILTANQVMEKGEYFCSPSKTYIIGMMDDLSFVDIQSNEIIWSAGVTGGARTILLEDGNMLIESEDGDVLWNTGEIPENDGFFNPQLVFWENNEGLVALQQTPTIGGASESPYTFWMEGSPRYESCVDCQQSKDLQFPVRGTLYYPTFDNSDSSWQDMDGNLPWHYPSMGFYSSSDPKVVSSHVEAMEYGNIDLGIAFWLGSGTNFDRSRITMLLDETSKQNANLKWTVSYEVEQRRGALSTNEIQSDLDYLKRFFAGHESWARIEGKPVIYINNLRGCDAVERWMSGAAEDWYVVMKIFDRYERCEYQPDSWYDDKINNDNDGVDILEGVYHNLAPGQWRKGRQRPDLERLSPREWCENVQAMQDSTSAQWHLITSFNDSNKGSSIEPSLDWRSDSRYGFFLDCLHDPQMF